MCALLVGLPDVRVVGVGEWPRWLRIVIDRASCERPSCCCGAVGASVTGVPRGRAGRSAGVRPAGPAGVAQAALACARRRAGGSWTEQDPRIASPRCGLTTGRRGGRRCRSAATAARSAEVADDLGCDWHTVMDAVVVYGTAADRRPGPLRRPSTRSGWTRRCSPVTARSARQLWSTQIVDVAPRPAARRRRLVATASSRAPGSPPGPRRGGPGSRWATLDLSASYRTVFDTMLPDAVQVADPFHVVQAGQHGAGRVPPPGAERDPRPSGPQDRSALPVPAPAGRWPRERLTVDGHERAARPARRRRPAAGGVVRLERQGGRPPDLRPHRPTSSPSSGSTRSSATSPTPRCRSRCAGSAAPSAGGGTRSSPGTAPTSRNGPTEAVNNLVKRVKRVAFGFRRFRPLPDPLPCSTPARPNWTLLAHPHPTMKSEAAALLADVKPPGVTRVRHTPSPSIGRAGVQPGVELLKPASEPPRVA